MSHPALTVHATLMGPHALAVAAGEIDHDTAPQLDQALRDCLAHRPASIDLDLTAVSFCDIAGLNVLLAAWVRATGTVLRLHDPSPAVARLLVLSGAAALFGLRAWNLSVGPREGEGSRAWLLGLTGFLRARLDEDDHDAELFHEFICTRHPGSEQAPPPVGCGCQCLVHLRLHAAADTSRRVMRAYEHRALGEDAWTPRRPLDALLAVDALKAMALPYELHPRWREEWRP